MTDLELIQLWPHATCAECDSIMRPSITREGKLLASLDGRIIWMVCSRCHTACSRPRFALVSRAENELDTLDMSHWIGKTTILRIVPQTQEEQDEMAEPLTVTEIMAMGSEQRDHLIQLRMVFKALVQSGLDPARIRATIATTTPK